MSDPDRTASLMTPSKLALQRGRPAAPPSPAAWLDQMAADAGHVHLARLGELGGVLVAHAGKREHVELGKELAQLGALLAQVDFASLQSHGWWSRATGKARTAGAGFVSQFDAADDAARRVLARVQALHKRLAAEASASDRVRLELEVEYHGLDRIVEQGARWLQDMRAQLQVRNRDAADDATRAAVRDDAERCDILVLRMKKLRGAAGVARQAHTQVQSTAAQRTGLMQALQQDLPAALKTWQTRLSPLAAAANDGRSPNLGLEGPGDAHRVLQQQVTQAVAVCGALQEQEDELAATVAALVRLQVAPG